MAFDDARMGDAFEYLSFDKRQMLGMLMFKFVFAHFFESIFLGIPGGKEDISVGAFPELKLY